MSQIKAGPDRRMAKQNDASRQIADEFRSQIPSYAQDQYSLAMAQTANDLKGQQKALNKQASSRGLLYSGLRQGAASDLQGQAASGLSAQREAINRALTKQSDQLDMESMRDAGIVSAYELKRKMLEDSAKRGEMLSNSQMVGSALGAAGSIAGGLLGGYEK
jgi:hypothetical protein